MAEAAMLTPSGGLQLTVGPARRASTGVTTRLNLGGSAYDAGGYATQELAGWAPRLGSADSEVLPARDLIVARGRHLYRNSGWVQGGIEKRVSAVVGSRIWLKAKPDFAALGMSAEWADEWSIKTESLFRLWANSPRFLCDLERHLNFGGLVRLAYQHYILDGEAAAALYFRERGGMFATCALVLDPDRLGNPDGRPDDRFLRAGVQLDRDGAAMGYWISDAHESDPGSGWEASRFTFIPRETPFGRPQFVHVFDKKRAHMRRGLGRLTSIMGRMKMLDTFGRSEIARAVTRSIFGMYATTERDSDGVQESLAPSGDDECLTNDAYRADFYEQADLTLNGVRIAVLPTGDQIKTIEADGQSTDFIQYERQVLNYVAGALGISGEQLSNDWKGINYSSARTLLNEIWRGLREDRHLFTQSFCTPIYAAWIEEAVARGLVDVPGGKENFYRLRDALTQCDWIGPGRGNIDAKKEADAAAINRAGFASTLEMDAAEQGEDWRGILWQAKREKEEMAKYGLTPAPVAGEGNAGGGDDSNSGDEETDAGDEAEMAQSGAQA